MKYVYIQTKYTGRISLPEELIKKLPKKVVLAMTVQYSDFTEEIIKQLESKEVRLFKSIHGSVPGQVLGCDTFKLKQDFDAFLFIGDGLFHPTALAYKNEKPVFMYDPLTGRHSELEWQGMKKKLMGRLSKYLFSERIGIIVSTKEGQNNMKGAQILHDKLKKEGKEPYIFITDIINPAETMNFPFIEAWVNTACPRLQQDFNAVNLSDIPNNY